MRPRAYKFICSYKMQGIQDQKLVWSCAVQMKMIVITKMCVIINFIVVGIYENRNFFADDSCILWSTEWW